MSLKSLKARLAKIRASEPEPEQARHSEYYEILKLWPYEKQLELWHLLREHDKLQAEEEARQERERRRQEELRAPATDPAEEEAAIDNCLQKVRDKVAAKKAEAQRREAALLHGNTAPGVSVAKSKGARKTEIAKDPTRAISEPAPTPKPTR